MRKIYKTISLPRKQIYEEVWNMPLKALAEKYSLNYQLLSEALKKSNVPYPQSGYWLKKRRNKLSDSDIIPLPESENEYVDLPLLEFHMENETNDEPEDSQSAYKLTVDDSVLSEMNKDDRRSVLKAAETIKINPNDELHSCLVEYRERIDRYRKKILERPSYYEPSSNYREIPRYVEDLSDECLERSILIMNALFKAVEELDGTIDESLDPVIHSDAVRLTFKETARKEKHVLTAEEKKMIRNDWRRFDEKDYWHAYGIRKYDEIFTGRLSVTIGHDKRIYDTEKRKIEDRLGEILILMYEEAQRKMNRRLPIEEMKRRIAEKQKQLDEEYEIRIREVNRTKNLLNKAEDFARACMIREYVAAMERKSDSTVNPEWIRWAKDKADWYDPSIAFNDPVFGKRNHGVDDEKKSFDHYTKRKIATYDNLFSREEIIEIAKQLGTFPSMIKYMI